MRSSNPRKQQLKIAADAFSDGQIGSKIWLCTELEGAIKKRADLANRPLIIWVLAGWHGLLPFLLFARENLAVEKIILFDIDSEAVQSSLKVNDRWRFRGQFEALTHDVNQPYPSTCASPDVVINTSCEHFSSDLWWSQLKSGTLVALQSTNMPHIEHVNVTSSAQELAKRFQNWQNLEFIGDMHFAYATLSFTRQLVIGIKGN